MRPNLSIEARYEGAVAGVDEAGRGPLAGPVFAAAVILPKVKIPRGIDDSKKLTLEARETIYARLQKVAVISVAMASVEEIDQFNILGATMMAMMRAVEGLPEQPKAVLVDGPHAPKWFCMTECVVGGDALSLSIAAASIIAKVERDRLMRRLHEEHPHYGWDSNMGYGAPAHLDGIAKHGVTIHHRRSFAPVRKAIDEAA